MTDTPHNLGLLGHHLAVSQGRIVSAIVLLLALLATAVLALIVRYTAPAGEAAAIRRRYAPLLAAVHPITTPSHLPLIEVAKFTTLAKLAERCGLLVLHWSRSNVDTFVVLDEGTTYRYRTGNDTESPAPPTSAESARPQRPTGCRTPSAWASSGPTATGQRRR